MNIFKNIYAIKAKKTMENNFLHKNTRNDKDFEIDKSISYTLS